MILNAHANLEVKNFLDRTPLLVAQSDEMFRLLNHHADMKVVTNGQHKGVGTCFDNFNILCVLEQYQRHNIQNFKIPTTNLK